nr:glycosyltransferase [Odontosoria chusana]
MVHVLAVPFQAEGHVNGLLRLARALAAMGVSVTFVYPARFYALASKRSQLDRDGDALLQFEAVEDGLPVEEEHVLTAPLLHASIPFFMKSVKHLLDRLLAEEDSSTSSHLPPLSCVISDCVVPWTKELADAAGLPRIPFWTSSAASYAMGAHLPLLISRGWVPVQNSLLVQGKMWKGDASLVDCIPGLPPFPITDLPSQFVEAADLSNPSLQFLAAAYEHAREAPSILIHSVYELESQVFDALKAHGFAVCPVGPLFFPPNSMRSHRHAQETLQWLDKKPTSSVVYVALGTATQLSPAGLLSLALGLEASGHPFLWVIRTDNMHGSLSNTLPEGFLDRTSARGLIVPWVPQAEVLRHGSVGAFFSHCGWNSTLESMFEGVPMVVCPQAMEQRSNARWIVEHWRMGVELEREVDGSFSKDAVERALHEVMHKTYKKGAVQVKEVTRRAVQEEGTSGSNLICLKQQLTKFHARKNLENVRETS